MALTSAAFVTSAVTATAASPRLCAALAAAWPSRSATMTWAPSATNLAAMPRPKPEAAPVTMAIFFCRRMRVLQLQPWWMAIVFSAEKPYSASKPFSRP